MLKVAKKPRQFDAVKEKDEGDRIVDPRIVDPRIVDPRMVDPKES